MARNIIKNFVKIDAKGRICLNKYTLTKKSSHFKVEEDLENGTITLRPVHLRSYPKKGNKGEK